MMVYPILASEPSFCTCFFFYCAFGVINTNIFVFVFILAYKLLLDNFFRKYPLYIYSNSPIILIMSLAIGYI